LKRRRRRCGRRCGRRRCGRRRREINIHIITYWFVSEIVRQISIIYIFKILILSVHYMRTFDVLV
jgi:hypothetical protein